MGGLLPLLCLSVCRVAHCGQTVQDRDRVCIEIEYEFEEDILIGTIFDPVGPP